MPSNLSVRTKTAIFTKADRATQLFLAECGEYIVGLNQSS